jgi:hypothetical protein
MSKTRVVLFASTEKIETGDRLNIDTGKIERRSFVPTEWAKEHGISTIPMPKNFELWRRRDGKKGKEEVRYLHELGPFVIAAIDEDGRIMNEYMGFKDFRKPVPVGVTVLEGLASLFQNGSRQ